VAGGYEKTVVLAIARAAADQLRRDGQVRVKLTRDDDIFIPLNDRVAIARREKADLLVSVHADSAPNPAARGASVYTLSETASDAVAARLAARENRAGAVPGIDTSAAPDVGDILIELTQRSTMNVSAGFAETLSKSLSEAIGFRGEFHHFAGFLVLKAADVPAVLIETGYLSNPDDAALLLSADGEKRIGVAIARAIEAHFAQGGR
jgi:N-acetylmuramoyl-L-alanine amidase